ncbi:hypothetical protein AB0K60_31485 [Thermopolyspora sp. NPDC052614]|uniref:hypothetical protein n=1 Tax=Thermopolyspora sp. NPDC052614 TaxID=3155682 RepID=UPI003412FCA7
MSALVMATGLVVVAALGGFAAVPEDPPPAVKAGEEIDQDLFRTTIVDAVVRTIPGEDDGAVGAGGSGGTGGSGGGGSGGTGGFGGTAAAETVLDLTFKVFNNATASVPASYLEESLLRIAPPEGPPLVAPAPSASGGGASATPAPAPTPSEPAWGHDLFIPADGVDSRLLPPQLTSTVVLRFPVRDGLTPPERLTVDLGEYELHEDWFTGRTRPELVTDDDGGKVVKARVTLSVKRGEG